MDLPTFFKWLDEEQPASAVDQQGKEDQSVVPSLSKRSQTLMDDQVLSAREDVRHKLQLMVDNIRNRVRTHTYCRQIDRQTDRQTDKQTDKQTINYCYHVFAHS